MAKQQQDRWAELCSLVRDDDELPTRDAGPWTFDKLWWWNRYIEITTKSMVGSPKWSDVIYVDLFAGPGICVSREGGERVPGSPLLAALAPKPFGKLLLCEERPELADACEVRLKAHNAADRSVVFRGDCNERIVDICQQIPPRSLTVAFIDPTGLHVDFSTIEQLTTGHRVDLFILFPDSMDIVRNVELYAGQECSNLDRFLGPACDWRAAWRALPNHTPTNVSKLFADIYKGQLAKRLGYVFCEDEVVRNNQGTPIYRLIYATKSERGLDFWKKITKSERNQKRLF